MKRVVAVVLGMLAVCAPVGGVLVAAAAEGGSAPPGWGEACSHQGPQEHNKHCEEESPAASPPADSPPDPPLPANGTGPTTAERAADCANDRDNDGNPWPDGCDTSDGDADGVPNQFDNCPSEPNHNQSDRDEDGLGDPCDDYPDDRDHDGVGDGDNCPSEPNPSQADGDRDHIGDACDGDQGNNGRPDEVDAVYAEVYGAAMNAADTALGSVPAP